MTQLVIINNEMNIDKRQQIYTAKGDGFDFAPAGILLLAGDTAYCSPTQTTAIGRLKAADFIRRVLSAATAAKYHHGDILLSLLQLNVPSERVRTMAQEACDIAGHEVFELAFGSCRDGATVQTVSTLRALLLPSHWQYQQSKTNLPVWPKIDVCKKNRDALKCASRCVFCLSAKPDCLAQ